jgi:hypothetical protein
MPEKKEDCHFAVCAVCLLGFGLYGVEKKKLHETSLSVFNYPHLILNFFNEKK